MEDAYIHNQTAIDTYNQSGIIYEMSRGIWMECVMAGHRNCTQHIFIIIIQI